MFFIKPAERESTSVVCYIRTHLNKFVPNYKSQQQLPLDELNDMICLRRAHQLEVKNFEIVCFTSCAKYSFIFLILVHHTIVSHYQSQSISRLVCHYRYQSNVCINVSVVLSNDN